MITEVDIQTFKQEFNSFIPSGDQVLLYEVPRNTVIDTPLGKFWFYKLDGAYSMCYQLDGELTHLSASTPVYICKYYEELKHEASQ